MGFGNQWGDHSLGEFDRKVLDQIDFILYNEKTIYFQFPPKIIGETNSSVWIEKDQWAIEALKIHTGSVGRHIRMEWEYIATDNTWDAKNIANNLRNLKSYFYEFGFMAGKARVYPLVYVRYMQIIPVITDFRMRDLNITYSEEIVENNGLHPLHTKVSVELEVATNLSAMGKDEVTGEPKIIAGALLSIKPEWY